MVVFLIVAVFLVWFAAISMQIFGYLNPEPGCERFGSDQFGNFFNVIVLFGIIFLVAFPQVIISCRRWSQCSSWLCKRGGQSLWVKSCVVVIVFGGS